MLMGNGISAYRPNSPDYIWQPSSGRARWGGLQLDWGGGARKRKGRVRERKGQEDENGSPPVFKLFRRLWTWGCSMTTQKILICGLLGALWPSSNQLFLHKHFWERTACENRNLYNAIDNRRRLRPADNRGLDTAVGSDSRRHARAAWALSSYRPEVFAGGRSPISGWRRLPLPRRGRNFWGPPQRRRRTRWGNRSWRPRETWPL